MISLYLPTTLLVSQQTAILYHEAVDTLQLICSVRGLTLVRFQCTVLSCLSTEGQHLIEKSSRTTPVESLDFTTVASNLTI